jgi:hypothetical protein
VIYFLDTSALVKRYLMESGSDTVRALFRRRHRIVVSRIAYAELIAAIARASREGVITETARNSVFSRIDNDFSALEVTELRRALMETIPRLVLRHPLRAYDAVQLASALLWKERRTVVEFWGADNRLLEAAQTEGLRTTLVGSR